MQKDSGIFIVGHNDIIESSLVGSFRIKGFSKVFSSSIDKIDVLSQKSVNDFFRKENPEFVFLASTRSGGIGANQKFPAEFIYSNLESQNNVINAAYQNNVKKLLYFAGSCAYPKEAPQPIKEESLLTASLEVTSEPYSVAKIAGVKMCQSYKRQYGFDAIVGVPATVFGPGSDADIETAHVIGALIGKFYDAVKENKDEVVVWGTGEPRREFIFADDFVDACLFLMERYESDELINIGCGYDVSIKELAQMIKEISGFKGKITFDTTKPNGTMKKLMDNSRIKNLGWEPKTALKQGIEKTFNWYQSKKETE